MNPQQPLFDKQKAYFKAHLQASTVRQRVRSLKKMKRWILQHQDDIRAALHADFKKPAHEVDLSEILPVVMEIKDAISNLPRWVQPRRVSTPMALIGTRSTVHHEPKGVSLILAPWNFPFMLTISPLVSAVAAGCTAIVKPSEVSEHTTKLIERMMSELFEEGEVAVVTGDYTVAQDLTALPFDHIFFTGSPQVGKKVMHAAADNLSSVTLELGGRNPVIIDASAKIGDTATKLVWGKFFNAGQSCMSPNYVMVHEKIYDKFTAALKKAFEKAYPKHHGNMSEATDYARVITPRHADRLRGLIKETVGAGAKALIGGDSGEGAYLPPTVLHGVEADHPIMKEEIFGPVMPILKYKHIDEALALIDSIEKPLGLYVFARNNRLVNKVIQSTSSGNVMINETTIAFSHPELPFGGVNYSGIGKAHGHAGFMAFTNEKPVVRQNTILPSTMLAHQPYYKWKNKILNLVIRYF